ncbi:MAG: hypothetical protein IPO58_05820 [Betaproteobacteria bacterium]|nr:hypothetical protein [Betaproteobacteria bacterium]
MMVASRFSATLFVLTMIVAVIPAAVRGAVPHVLNFQGYLTTSNGTPVTATVSMQFKLYASDTGGSPIYSETQPSVAVTNGQFNVVIGTPGPIPDNVPFDQPYWLAITVGGDAEMEPRQLLGASPYAIRSATTEALGAGATVPGSQITGTINSATMSGAQITGTISAATLPATNLTGNVPVANGGTGMGAAGAAGNVLRSDGSAWTSSALQPGDIPDLGNSFVKNSTSLQSGNFNISGNGMIAGYFGVGTQVPESRVHIAIPASFAETAPRVESTGSASRATAGWEFYHGQLAKGFVGVPDSNSLRGPGEMILFGDLGVSTSIWAGGGPRMTFFPTGHIAIGGGIITETKLAVRSEFSLTTAIEGVSYTGIGVHGYTESGKGIYGQAALSGDGVSGDSQSGRGIVGASQSGTGVYGTSSAASVINAGVYGAGGASGSIGVIGESSNGATPTGVYGVSSNATGFGVYARNNAATTGWALAAEGPRAANLAGDVQVLGTLSKGAGSFMIDHPLDPANKYLYHSFVESPDMKNIYDGNVTTDGTGHAEVALPDWFEALNRDFRYQLTVIGTFAQAIVAKKVAGNRFTIATSAPNVEVSWQVTGIRQDAYANKHRIPVEQEKPVSEQGTFLHPEAYGQPKERGLQWHSLPVAMKQDLTR